MVARPTKDLLADLLLPGRTDGSELSGGIATAEPGT